MRAELERLRAELAAATAATTAAAAAARTSREAEARLTEQVRSLGLERDRLLAEGQQAGKPPALQDELEQAVSERDALRHELETTQQQLSQEKAELEEELQQARTEAETALGEVVNLQLELDQLKETNQELEAAHQADQTPALQGELEQAVSERDALRHELETAQQQFAQEKAELEEELQQARAETETALGDVVNLQLELDQFKEAGPELEAARQELASLGEELQQQRAAAEQAALDRDRLQEQVDSLTAANDVLDREAEELRGQIAGADADAATARDELAAYQAEGGASSNHELTALQEALAEARAEAERQADRVAELEAARGKPVVEAPAHNAVFTSHELSERLAAAEARLRETEALLAARSPSQPADSDKLRNELAKLQRENNKLRQWLGNFGIHMT